MTANPATETIWSQLSDDLRRFIRRRVVNDHLADDLLQETFLRIHRNGDRLHEADHLAAWVYRIARNVINDHYRERNETVSLADNDVAENDGAPDQLKANAGIWLTELIGQLPPIYREPLKLSEIDGLPQRDVADRLGLSVSGAKSRIQRGRLLLRDVLDRCCVFEFDRRGNVMDCDPKPERKVCLDCGDLEIRPPSRT